jgi:hypothetical protein
MTRWPRLRLHLKTHWAAYLVAVAVGCICVAPSVLARISIGSADRGIPPMFLDNEDYYFARIHDVVNGNWLVGSPAFYEYKHLVPLIPPVGEYFYALPVILLKIPLVDFFVFSKFLFPAALSLLAYVLAWRLSSEDEDHRARSLVASAAGLLVTIGFDFTNVGHVIAYFLGRAADVGPSIWTRPVNPITGGLLLFAYLNLLLSVVRDRRRRDTVIAGIVLGLMSGYVFSWGVALAATALLALAYAVRHHGAIVKRLVAVVLIAAALVIPYALFVLSSLTSGGAKAAERNGLLDTHAPMWNKVSLGALLVFLVVSFLWKRFRPAEAKDGFVGEPWWMLCLALLLGSVAIFVQPIVTGRTIWPYHFVQYTIPVAYVAVLMVIHRAVQPFPRLRKAWIVTLVALCAAIAAFGVGIAKSYASRLGPYRDEQANAPIYDWLNANAKPDCVVYVHEPQGPLSLIRTVPTFTRCSVYASDWVYAGDIPLERVSHDYFVYLRFSGVTADGIEAYLRAHESDLRSYFFDNFYNIFSVKPDQEWLDRTVQTVADGYRDFLKQDFSKEVHQYKIDYILATSQDAERINTLLPGLTEIRRFGERVLYEIN